jgi:hypothetical protein
MKKNAGAPKGNRNAVKNSPKKTDRVVIQVTGRDKKILKKCGGDNLSKRFLESFVESEARRGNPIILESLKL